MISKQKEISKIRLKFTAENPHGDKIIVCPLCGFNNCKSASDESEMDCWCFGKEFGYNVAEPCCFSNFKESGSVWWNVGKKPKRTREFIKLQRKKLTEFIGKVK